MKLTLVLSSIARSVSLTATSRPPGSLESGRSNPFLVGVEIEMLAEEGVSLSILQGFIPETLGR